MKTMRVVLSFLLQSNNWPQRQQLLSLWSLRVLWASLMTQGSVSIPYDSGLCEHLWSLRVLWASLIAQGSVSHKSGLAPMGSLFRVSPGGNQGVGCAGSLLDYSGKDMLSSSFRLLVKFRPCGWRVEVSVSSRPLISFSCVSFIFMPAMVHQMPLCFESTWISLLLLVREYSAFKGFTWLGQVYADCLCILRSTDRELQLSAISLPSSTSIHAWLENRRTGSLGRLSLEFHLPWFLWGWCQLTTRTFDQPLFMQGEG